MRRSSWARFLLAVVHGALLAVGTAGGGGGCRSSRDASAEANRDKDPGQALVPDGKGRVDGSTTGTTGISGRWFANADTEGCRTKGKHAARECSLLIAPDPRTPDFGPTGDLGMCTVGVAAKAVLGLDGHMDWGTIFGARIGLTLHDDGPFDGPAHGVTGFRFHIDSEPPPNAWIRVEVATEATRADPPWWGGATAEVSPVHAGDNQFRWADVGGPLYVSQPPPFDAARVISIAFRVPSEPAAAKTFSFCISHLTTLTN